MSVRIDENRNFLSFLVQKKSYYRIKKFYKTIFTTKKNRRDPPQEDPFMDILQRRRPKRQEIGSSLL
ncbi:hypothetical protein D2Q93_14325 [Alicyclobacillaceae bacterium I2511]|nr:hypothetical protein D2Q93_14325 [Alicyclobacillaceae bacterium I2511]